MDAARVVTIELHPIGVEPAEDRWCSTCLLPAALQLDYVGVNPLTLRPVLRGRVRFCPTCGRLPDDAAPGNGGPDPG